MPHHPIVEITGRITDIFAHRFVIEQSSTERLLADLGPKGAEQLKPGIGQEVTIEGEQHPSEIKVSRFTRAGTVTEIARPPKPGGPNDELFDPAIALDAVRNTGAEIIGEPRRGPKHYEVLAKRDGEVAEYHVHADGRIGKTKPVRPGEPKWAGVMLSG
ncbi:MAG: hypothetical protein ABIQ30_07490 [Devosia sp.]